MATVVLELLLVLSTITTVSQSSRRTDVPMRLTAAMRQLPEFEIDAPDTTILIYNCDLRYCIQFDIWRRNDRLGEKRHSEPLVELPSVPSSLGERCPVVQSFVVGTGTVASEDDSYSNKLDTHPALMR